MQGGRIWGGVLVLAAFAVAGPAVAASLPRCAGHVEVSGAKIVRAEINGALVLADGRAVVAEGIRLPMGQKDHAPSFLAHQALATLRDLTKDRHVTLTAQPPKEDRYGRIRAQVFFPQDAGEPWLQIAMLRRGLARVDIAPDRRECATELYAAEREARAQRTGIWAFPAYAVRTPQTLGGDVGTFQIVEGTVRNATVGNGRAYLNFGADWHSDFTATISPDDMKVFRAAGVDPRSYAGDRVRVRGWIQTMNGPEMEVAAPEAIEVLAASTATASEPGAAE